MRIVAPIPLILGGTVVSTTASAAGDPAAWSAVTAYVAADQVTYNDYIYTSILAGTNKQPDTQTTYWARTGTKNQLAMFDSTISTQTENADTIVIVLQPGQSFNTLALRNMDAASVSVVQNDPTDGDVYSETIDLVQPVGGYYLYFFSKIVRRTSCLFLGFRPYSNSTVTVTITKTGGTVKCGLCAIGFGVQYGYAEYGAEDGVTDYSRVETDEWGIRDIVPRDYADDASFTVPVPVADSESFRNELLSRRAQNTLIILSDDRPDIQYYGLPSFRRVMNFWDADIFRITMKGST